jgi:hypothetical protein
MHTSKNECLAPKLSRPKFAIINHFGTGGRRPKTDGMDTTCYMHYTWNSKRVTGMNEVDG